jgi:hypothetical protein
MRDGKDSRALARSRALMSGMSAVLVAVLALPVNAQTPGSPPAENPTAKSAPPKASAAPAATGASEDLPWLATTKPAETAPPKKAAEKTPAKTAPTPPAASPKKSAGQVQKCADQSEDSCRGIKTCAWVAAIPLGDGNVTPARCADRKVSAADKEKKPKPAVAAKPKPKPDDGAAQAGTDTPPAPAHTAAAKSESKSEPKAETAAIPEARKSDSGSSPVASPVEPEAPKVEAAPAELAKPAAVKTEAPLVIPPRASVPFLPPEQPNAAVPAVQPHSDATPPNNGSENKVAAEEPAVEKPPLSIPGLVISE